MFRTTMFRSPNFRSPAFPSIAPLILALLGFGLCVWAYYPGLLEPDSLEQFQQAQTGRFTDWHPPIMALLWRGLDALYFGPQPLFLLHLALFWSALALVGRALMSMGVRSAAFVPLWGLAPWVVPLLGVLISDTALASAWLFATAVVLHQGARDKPANAIVLATAAAAFIYGALARANTILAAAPLVYFACAEWAPNKARLRFIAAATAPMLVLALAGAFNIVVATSEYPMGSLQVFDIAGISHRIGRNLLPGAWSAQQSEAIVHCYNPETWDVYEEPLCARAAQQLETQNLWNASGLTGAWLRAIVHHPGDYLAHRLDYANHFFRWLGDLPPGDIDYDTEPSAPAAFAHRDNPIYDFYSDLAETNYVALRPYFWLVLGLAIGLLSALARPSKAKQFSAALSLSAVIYLLFYIIVGVACDFRYALWSICATLTALAALPACRWQLPRLLAGGAAGALLMGFAIGAGVIAAHQ